MKLREEDPPVSKAGSGANLDDIISDLFHDAQNGVHMVGMELELVSIGLGNSADTAKTAAVIKQLENNLRDLRGYVSAVQYPTATCDLNAVVATVAANVQTQRRNELLQLRVDPSECLADVRGHVKLLTRMLERVFEFCEDLLSGGGEIRVRATRRQAGEKNYAEIDLTIVGSMDIPVIADQQLGTGQAKKSRPQSGIERALEVLRRQRGESLFRRHDSRCCQLTLRLLSSPA
jgi:hypothetical protein